MRDDPTQRLRYCKTCNAYGDHVSTQHDGLAAQGLTPSGRVMAGPGECGECDQPEQFEWDPIRWVDGAPVIVCKEHHGLAPGWVYHRDDIGVGR